MTSAQESTTGFTDSLRSFTQPDSAIRVFLDRIDQLPADERDSCFSLLQQTLDSASPQNVFEFTRAHTSFLRGDMKFGAWNTCLSKLEAREALDTFYYTRALNYYGEQLYGAGLKDSAKALFLQVIDVIPPGHIDEELAVAHNNLGIIFSAESDPGSALPNYEKAQDIFMQLLGPDHVYIAVIGSNLGQVYGTLGRLDEQIRIQERSREIYLQRAGPESPRTADININLGIAYRHRKEREKAMNALQEALEIRTHLGDRAGEIAALAEIAALMKAFPTHYSTDQVKTVELGAVDRGVAHFDSVHPGMRNTYNNYAFTLFGNQEYALAIQYLQLALRCAYPSFSPASMVEFPSVETIGSADLEDLKLIENKAYFLYEHYEQSRDLRYLQASHDTYSTGDSIVDILRSRLLHGDSRSTLIREAIDYYINATRTAIKLYITTRKRQDLGSVFAYVEKSRNWRIIEQYLATSQHSTLLEDGILQEIQSARNQIPDELGIRSGSTTTDSAQQLVSVRLEQLRREYPEYFRYLYATRIATLDSVELFCRSTGTQWLHFVPVSRASFGLILCTPDTTVCQLIPAAKAMHASAARLIDLIESGAWSFAGPAHDLYNYLIRPVSDYLTPGHLVISTSGLTDKVPFDILMNTLPVDTTDFRSFAAHYLLNDFDISLMQSGTFGLTTYSPDDVLHKSVFIAPEYTVSSLSYSTDEVTSGSHHLKGKVFTGPIDKRMITNQLARSDLVHFAGHSFGHEGSLDSIFLLVGDQDTLYLRELFSVRSRARLAVLSSCNSATGVRSGDGNVSLAYGFAFAGTPNVLSSLWQVSDRESTGLFESYYGHLAKGMNSIQSLRLAKLAHLSNAPLPARHPSYWANWVYRGHPLTHHSRGCWNDILSFGILLLALVSLFSHRGKSGR